MPDRDAECPFCDSRPSHFLETLALDFRKQGFLP
jgi:hypothetical protein